MKYGFSSQRPNVHMGLRITLCLLAILLLPACNFATQDDLSAVYSRITYTEKQIGDINTQLGITGSSVPGQAEMWAEIQGMRQDLNLIQGQLESANLEEGSNIYNKVNKLDAAVRQMASELAMDIPALSDNSTPDTTDTNSASVANATVEQDLPSNLYNAGTKAFSDRKYSEAVNLFNQFIENYPSHSLISNAYFWRGESYYQLKAYNNAITAYQKIIDSYTQSNKLQSAMFKQGVSLFYNNQKVAGKVRLDELVSKYPKSPEAARAKDFISKNL